MQRALQERELAQELSAQEEQPAELEMRVPGQERCREVRVWPGGQGQALRRKARVRPVV